MQLLVVYFCVCSIYWDGLIALTASGHIGCCHWQVQPTYRRADPDTFAVFLETGVGLT